LAFEQPGHQLFTATSQEILRKYRSRKFRRDNGSILAKEDFFSGF
jgi:hypothetical protein